ncbi:CHAT domain-containing protein [Gordonia amarae]|uniref:CHAT domain-containing protein n=1 Tax=Gordonia amarae TaxID=36821 RepID=A0A857LQE7_9ACTN|nr:CHAT domain-containing protein [Gordonia amarae]MCS3880002.1 hypothetical protein [Gordonia amarae]QHN18387.1 CHAT domain-containing protein [Gordonia amarae]QHN22869.1 CHAT domain-containing protein [Gordonia amarae]QHN31772.1 CHAT domain-containing protein [Gordonia amarae]QHN40518.1 CHAT domain-containing protein [Gordonia amarae]
MPETPTLLVKFAEAGGAYLTWRWIHDDGPGPFAGMAQVSAAQVDAVRDTLARAVPDTLPGESVADGIDRALLRGPFSHPESTATLARDLGQVLLSADLVTALRQAPARPLLRIQPSESLTRVPWEMLLVDDATTLDDLADVTSSAPSGVPRHRVDGNPDGPVVAVIDPRIPGQSVASALGSVLGRPADDSPLAVLVENTPGLRPAVAGYRDLARRTDIDREWLCRTMTGAFRLLYVGHVSAAAATGESVDAALHLCCTDDSGAHRPLRVDDLLTGDYRFPPRTALIGCNSGGDLAHPDGMGLSMAALAAGAQLVTATRWAVPTNRALSRAGDLGDRAPLEELVLAVDAAHRGADPVGHLRQWQAERRARWYDGGLPADTPLLWAALTTTI